MTEHSKIVDKYPHLKDDLDRARELQEMSSSVQGRALYKQKQNEINSLIPKIIELARVWNENELRYTITKMEILRDEIISVENNSRAYDTLVQQIENGDFDNSIANDDE